MINEQGFPGVWGVAHITYFVITITLLVTGLILINKFVKKESTIKLIVKITAAILLALVITNRIAYTYQYVVLDPHEGFTWWYLFPETFCAVTAISLSVIVLCTKKDAFLIHGTIYMGLIGSLTTTFYPDFLIDQYLFELGTMTSLIYHTVMLFLVLLMISTKYVKPTTRRWYAHPLVYIVMMCYGLFYCNVLPHDNDRMTILGINIPVVKSQPILTSWWMIGIGYLAAELAFIFFYDHFVNKKSFKKMGDEFIHFYRYINQ